MIEAVNKTLKYRFLFKEEFSSLSHLNQRLPDIIQTYNNSPHSSLFGFTPQEVFLDGVVPSKKAFNQTFRSKSLFNHTNRDEYCEHYK